MKKLNIAGRDFDLTEEGVLLDKLGRKRPLCITPDGYLFYSLTINQKKFSLYVHRIIWMLHNGAIPDDKVVDHIDDDKTNNDISNLQLLSPGENVAKSKQKEYLFISPEGLNVRIINMRKFCRENGLSDANMIAVAKGRANSHKGWKLYDSN